MPGIAGLITKIPRECAERQLAAMLGTLRHEPFYVTGTWIDESMGVYVGWSAQKDSFADGMPLSNETGDVVLIFAGEEFPEPGTAARLTARGHVLGSAEASYLVHLYEEDPSFPAGLNGLFHALLVDRAQRTVTLMNDRYGMQRLYYHESKDVFYFAAEAKAILAVRSELRSLDLASLGELIALNAVLENRSLFQRISILPAASLWSFRNGALEHKGVYFHPGEWEAQPALDPDTYCRELRESFSQNLPRYFAGRQRVAMSLTGGLDTRAVMAWYKGPEGSLPCYTFGGPYRDSQDVMIARRIADVARQPFAVIPVGAHFLSDFAEFAERTVYLTDGCAGVNRAPDLYANKIAREIAPVRVTGNYGSEVLRRLRMFKPATPKTGIYRPELLRYAEEAKYTYDRVVRGHAVTFTAFRQAPWCQFGMFALESTQLMSRSPYLDNDLVRTAFRAPSSAVPKNDLFEDNAACSRLIAEGDPALGAIPTDRGLGGARGRLLGAIARSFLEFTFRAEYAYDYGMPQWVARVDHALSPLHLERIFLGRHKFCHFRVWYRDRLAGYIKEMLLDSVTLSRPFLERAAVERLVRGHLKGDHNFTMELHQLLTLELINRLLFDRV